MSLSAGILAGGEGRRFGGADKGWIEVAGRPLIEHVLAALRPQADEILISANRNLERYAALGVPVLADAPGIAPGAHQGPLAGMVILLEAALHPWLLCVPCDALRLAPDFAARMLARAELENAAIAALHDGERLHPLFCLLRTTLAADARARFAAGERSPREWFRGHRVALVPGPTPVNLNTPADLANL